MESLHLESGKLKTDLVLPDRMREELRIPLGEVFPGKKAISALREGAKLLTVGDKCTLTFVEEEIVPDIFVVDYKIKRELDTNLRVRFEDISDIEKRVSNPAGMITRELWSAILESLSAKGKVRIEVEGEEDLATIPCIYLAEEGSQVAYGLPGQGMVLVNVDDESKNNVKKIIEKMWERNAS